jgi:hypothetical protein
MKRILATGAVAAFAMVGFAAPANADGHLPAAACFGQVHKQVNDGLLSGMGLNNVGDAVKALGGQGKNDFAKAACAGD